MIILSFFYFCIPFLAIHILKYIMTKLTNNIKRKPEWLKIRLPLGEDFAKVNKIVKEYGLHTICQSGKCPNMGDCWGRGTATFMILGDICTRSCKFCNVKTGKPNALNEEEAENVAISAQLMKLNHCVITSVDRDDLDDCGAKLWAKTIRKIKEKNPDITIEALIPDFNGRTDLIDWVINEKPEVISHNLETVKRLTPKIRSKAKYKLSLSVLEHIAKSGLIAKSGIMLGLGESPDEILETMDDLLAVGCTVLTLGQYLQPTPEHYPVIDYITPENFNRYKKIGLYKGFKHVESSPLVRSSYQAEKHIK